jgi:hypothetical protein
MFGSTTPPWDTDDDAWRAELRDRAPPPSPPRSAGGKRPAARYGNAHQPLWGEDDSTTRTAAGKKDPRFRSWPFTELAALESELKAMGMRQPAGAVADAAAALVRVGPAGHGGTGSFISSEGLIITNHHVAMDAVRQASTPERDHLAQGFVARSRAEEISGADYEAWITTAQVDCSAAVLAGGVEGRAKAIAAVIAEAEAALATAAAGGEAAAAAMAAGGGSSRCQVSEMFPAKSYTLFTYERLRDIRIVHVPPFALGNFGGEADNFEWPRHTADFTLLRAYTGPGGECAPYGPGNVPYTPRHFLRVQPKGAAEGDFVMALGFPGFTMRYAPSCRLRYSQDVAVPHLVGDFGAKLTAIKQHSAAHGRAVALKLLRFRKSLANELKRSGGKLLMMKKVGLVAERAAEEVALCAAFPGEARPLLDQLAAIYGHWEDEHAEATALRLLMGADFAGSATLHVAHALCANARANAQHGAPGSSGGGGADDEARPARYRTRNAAFLAGSLAKKLADCHLPLEREQLAQALLGAASALEEAAAAAAAAAAPVAGGKVARTGGGGGGGGGSGSHPSKWRQMGEALKQRVSSLSALRPGGALHSTIAAPLLRLAGDERRAAAASLADRLLAGSALAAAVRAGPEAAKMLVDDALQGGATQLNTAGDALLQLADALLPASEAAAARAKAEFAARDKALAALLALEQRRADACPGGEPFYPDANSTLRLTAGHVAGYSSADAAHCTPITTLTGLVEKADKALLTPSAAMAALSCGAVAAAAENEFQCPTRVRELWAAREFGPFATDVHGNGKVDVPVNICYSTDTVGGNSGSPVVNADGELVGVNFDRQSSGLMNEFKWSSAHSRSVGVDVRFVLWLLHKVDGATHLLEEMGVRV